MRLLLLAWLLCLWLPGPAQAQTEPGPPVEVPAAQRVRVAVLPFEIHSASPLGSVARRLEGQLRDRLASDPRIEVLDPDRVSRAASQAGIRSGVDRGDERLRALARSLEADAVVSASITELAGRYSLDLRVTPAVQGARATTLVDTAERRDVLAGRLAELADRVVARLAGERGILVREIQLVGAGEIEAELRDRLQSRVGLPYDADVARADGTRLEAHPSVASVSQETEREGASLVLRYRIVRSELLFGESAAGGGSEVVREVRIRGNRRIETDAILARIRSRAGEPLRPALVANDVRDVFGLGFFRDVRVFRDDTEDGLVLIFEVVENPVVRQIAITGNDELDSDKIKEVLTLTTGSTLDLPLLHENVQRIEALYRAEGYYLAEVGFDIRTITEGSVAIEFGVEEKKKLKLRTVAFEGNEAFSDSALRDGFATKRWRFWSYATSWFDKSGTYSEPIFLRDLRSVEKKYADAGYLQIEVGDPVVDPSEDGLTVTVPIREGPRFDVGDIDVDGDESVDFEVLRGKLKLETGDVFNRSHLTEDVESLERHYTDRGFFYANVQPLTDVDPVAKTVDVRFRVEKGPLYFIRQIRIQGNDRTVDPVIRRELQAVEGQLYSARAMQISSARVRRLGYFEDVAFEPRPTEDRTQLDLDLNVVERPTGAFSFGAGFSSQDSFIFTASLSEQNLFGRGFSANLSADIGQRSSAYFLSLRDNSFLGTDWSVGATLFLRTIRFEDFEQEQQGFNLSLGHSLSRDNSSRGTVRYSYSQREIRRNTGVNAAAVIFRELLQGNESTSQIGISLNTDTRNDRFAPTSGLRYGANIEYAGLGGFANFLRFEGRFTWYLGAPKWLLDRSTFVFGTRLGYVIPFNDIDDFEFRELDEVPGCDTKGACDGVARLDQIDTDLKLPLTERYFLGGLGTFQLRGYEARSVGPRRAILRRTGLTGEGDLFLPVGRQVVENPVDNSLSTICNDDRDSPVNNQGNGNGKCNDIDDEDIDDFEDLRETDVIGGNKFIASSFEYRFPISEEVGLQGVLFVDGGNAFAENEQMWDPQDWRYGWGAGVLWFSPFGPLQLVLGWPVDPLPDEDSPVFEFSVGGFGI